MYLSLDIIGKAHIIYAEEVYEVAPFVIGVATSEKAALEMISEAQKVMGPAYEYFYDVVDFNTMGMNDKKYIFSNGGRLENKSRLVDDELLFHRVRVDEDILMKYKSTYNDEELLEIIEEAKSSNHKVEEISCEKGNVYVISENKYNYKLIIPSKIEEIEESVNSYLQNLRGNIKVIGGSGLKDISDMFSHCKVNSLDLSKFDTSKVTNMSSMFYGCDIEELNLSRFDTSNVTDMSYMFSRCNIEKLKLSIFDTSKVTNMSYMFCGCGAEKLDLSSFNTSNVTNMSSMFFGCDAYRLDLSNFDTSNVTDMSSMFSGYNAYRLDLSSFDTSKVTDMSYMFYDSDVNKLNLSSFDTSKVTDMTSMFEESKVEKLDLRNFDTSKVENMEGMFNRINVSYLDLSNFDISKLKNAENIFWHSAIDEISFIKNNKDCELWNYILEDFSSNTELYNKYLSLDADDPEYDEDEFYDYEEMDSDYDSDYDIDDEYDL